MTSAEELIPMYLCYNGYTRLLTTLYQMETQKRIVTINALAEEMELLRRSTKAGLIFLKSINAVTEKDGQYRLTPSGFEYAYAIHKRSRERLKDISYSILCSSRLSGIVKRLEEESRDSSNRTIEKLYSIIKREASIGY